MQHSVFSIPDRSHGYCVDDNARALILMNAGQLDSEVVHNTLNVLLKFEADIEAAGKQIAGMTHKARQDAGVGA